MQGIGQGVLDGARALLPMLGIVEPLRPVRDEGPGPDLGEPARQGVEVAVGAVGKRHLAGEPVSRNLALVAHDEAVKRGDKLGMARGRNLPVVGDLAHLPEEADAGLALRQLPHLRVMAHILKRDDIVHHARTRKPRMVGRDAQALL